MILYASDYFIYPDINIDTQTQNYWSVLKSLSNYKSVNLHNVEEMRDVNSWRLGSCCQVRKAKVGAEVIEKKGGKRVWRNM